MATDHNFKVKNGLDVEGANIKIVDGGSGAALFDASGDIILDADGADILLKDGGTEFGRFTQLIGGLAIGAGSPGGSYPMLISSDKVLVFKDMQLGDNEKLIIGDGATGNLQIFHDGTDSFLDDIAEGNLILRTNGDSVKMMAGSENMVVATKDGSVDLYHNNGKRLETTTSGVTISGSLKTDRIECLDNSLDHLTFIDLDMDTGGSAGTNNLVLGGVNNVDLLIDTNNNSTTSSFVFGADANTMGSATELMRLTEAGRLGIGTSSPANKLHVSDGGGAGLEINPQTTNDRVILFAYDRNTSTYQSMDFDATDFHFNPGGTEKVRIDSSGRVLIGTSTSIHSSADLQIQGASGNYARILMKDQDGTNQVGFIDQGGGDFALTSQNGTSHGTIGLKQYNGSATLTRLHIDNTGKIGIGTTSPATTLEVAGDVTLPSNGQIKFKGTNHYPRIYAASNDLKINLDDGAGNNFTALAIDNAAGNSTFSGTISSGAITSSGALKSTNATGLILDTGASYRDVQFVLTGTTGNGTLEIIPMTVPGSGTATFTTHIKNFAATGTTRHDLKVDGNTTILGQLTVGSGNNIVNAGNMTIDAGGDITLDADGGDVILRDGGTEFGRFSQVLGGLTLKSGSSSAIGIIFDGSGNQIVNGNISIADNKQIDFGTDDDLIIKHDGTNNLIQGSAGVVLYIQAKAGENSILAIPDGAVQLYHDNSKKFETKSDGVDITGELQSDSLDVDGNADISGNLALGGNLTVNGTTTTVNSTNTTITDALIELNSGLTGANTNDIGFIFERGSTGSNMGIIFDESADAFAFINTATSTGATTGNVVIDGYQKITAGHGSRITGDLQVGDTVNQNAFGILQVNQTSNVDEEGIGILSASHARSMRLWVDESVSYVSSGDGGVGILSLNHGGGNVGIGTNNPILKLQVVGDIYANTGSLFLDSGKRLKWGNSQQFIEGTNSGPMEFGTGNAVRMVIENGGNVGIGTNAPLKTLVVNFSSSDTNVGGQGLSGGGSGAGLQIKNTNTTAGVYANLDFRANNADGRILYKYNSVNDGDFHFVTDNNDSVESKMVIKNTGNVGIGTTSPSAKLDVNGTVTSDGLIVASDTDTISTLGRAKIGGFVTDYAYFSHIDNATSTNYALNQNSTGATSVNAKAGTSVSLKINNVNKLTVDSSGNTNIAGDVAVSGDITITDTSTDPFLKLATSERNYVIRVDNSDADKFQIRDATASLTRLSISSGGKVGIGTVSPNQQLEVAGRIRATTDPTFEAFESSSKRGGVQWNTTGDYLNIFSVGGDIVLDTNGENVGIGTTNPTNHLNTSTNHLPTDANATFLTINGGANGAFVMLESSTTTDADQIGGLVFTRTGGQADAHKNIASIDCEYDSASLGGGILRFFTKPNGSGTPTPRMKIDQTGNVTMTANLSASGIVSGSEFRPTNIVTNKVVKFNGTQLDDSNITDTGSLITLGSNTTVSGSFAATTKSFDIEHPTKEDMRLHHGVLEGPEHAVYIRGKSNSYIIELPDYWKGLVHEDTITVQLTPIGGQNNIWVENIEDNKVYIECDREMKQYFYFIQAERKDVERFEVEYGNSL